MDEEKVVSPGAIEPKTKKHTFLKFCCGSCGVLFVLVVGGVLLMMLAFDKSCDTNFNIPNIFKSSPSSPSPPGSWFPEDFSNLPEYTIIERYRDSINIGVAPDVSEKDLKKLNRYLIKTYFPGMTVFNVAFFNKSNMNELIAVYNYNSFTGTDNFTMLASEPGARFPASQ
jgi:hypothetical protein